MNMNHTPVMLSEVVEALQVSKGKRYIDATMGQLGHLNKIRELGGEVLGLDYDEQQIKKASQQLEGTSAVVAHGNFADIEAIAKKLNFYPLDGVLFDLGISYGQLKENGIGLSYKNSDEPLDMRLIDQTKEDAADFLNSANEEEIYMVLARYGEEPLSQKIARAIIIQRSKRKIKTVGDLRVAIDTVAPNNDSRVYSRIFQALRMLVNDELENLQKGFSGAMSLLKSGGVLVIITFHSGEDRQVKRLIRTNKEFITKDWKVRKKMAKSFERSALMRVVVRA